MGKGNNILNVSKEIYLIKKIKKKKKTPAGGVKESLRQLLHG